MRKPLSEVVRIAFTPATPENLSTVFAARFALMSIIVLIFIMTGLIVLLIGPPL